MATTEGHALEELAALAQKLYQQRALKVDAVHFEWEDHSTFGDVVPKMVVVGARGAISIIVSIKPEGEVQ